MSKIVLDASALLAVLHQETGAEKLTPELLGDAACSTVNLAEVQSKLVKDGINPDDAWRAALTPVRDVVAFTPDQAKIAGTLISKTRSLGLSLADRACLALGTILDCPVYTADRSWKNLKTGVRIRVIR